LASIGNPGPYAYGCLFRNKNANILGCFALNLGVSDAYLAELVGVISATEFAHRKGWNQLWLETDSKLVTLGFKYHSILSFGS
jgi:ribonuclease HI